MSEINKKSEKSGQSQTRTQSRTKTKPYSTTQANTTDEPYSATQASNESEPYSATQTRGSAATENRNEAHRRIAALRVTLDTTRHVGSLDELVPFAWRKPLIPSDSKRQSRILKTMALQESERMRAAKPEQGETDVSVSDEAKKKA